MRAGAIASQADVVNAGYSFSTIVTRGRRRKLTVDKRRLKRFIGTLGSELLGTRYTFDFISNQWDNAFALLIYPRCSLTSKYQPSQKEPPLSQPIREDDGLMSKITYNLYRVSTKKQLYASADNKNDIPMQRKACCDFAECMGWEVGREFDEKGISGSKVSANKHHKKMDDED